MLNVWDFSSQQHPENVRHTSVVSCVLLHFFENAWQSRSCPSSLRARCRRRWSFPYEKIARRLWRHAMNPPPRHSMPVGTAGVESSPSPPPVIPCRLAQLAWNLLPPLPRHSMPAGHSWRGIVSLPSPRHSMPVGTAGVESSPSPPPSFHAGWLQPAWNLLPLTKRLHGACGAMQ